jgi:hypothetical protein
LRGYVRRLGDGVRDRQATVNCRWAGGRFSRREGNRWASGRARIWVPVCALSGGTKHGVPLYGATLAPPIERRTGEASVIVAADGLTASDAVSCQLNLEHIHNRQPVPGRVCEDLVEQTLDTANRSAPDRHGSWYRQRTVRSQRQIHERRDNGCSISTPAAPPLGAARGRADPRLLHGPDGDPAIPVSARNQRGLPSGSGPHGTPFGTVGLVSSAPRHAILLLAPFRILPFVDGR